MQARTFNGIVSAVITVFFLVHEALGSASPFSGISSPVSWLVWCGIALVCVHVIASVVTSWQQLTDAEYPPSQRKKRHLALKWATGILVLGAVACHVAAVRFLGAASMHAHITGTLAIVALAVLLAVHLCVGSKSLLKDLNINRRYKMVFRVIVCVLAALFVVAALVAFAMT